MKKTLLTIIITALVVGGGYYVYDNYSLTEKGAEPEGKTSTTEEADEFILLEDPDYNLKFTHMCCERC
jgi:hypothetical protein